MARQNSIGLSYFSLDVNISEDDKIQLIESEFGLKGFAILIKLFAKIYADKGYYYKWTEDERLLFAKKLGEPGSLVDEVIKRSVKRGIFNESVFNKFQVLTSASIQRRYLDGCIRRNNIEIFKEFLIININDYKNKDNVNINSINDNISTQSKVKKSKVKESKAYREFAHLSISTSEFEKLVNAGFEKNQIDTMLDKVENYGKNKNYTSLYLTVLNWLKDDAKRNETSGFNTRNGSIRML